MAKAAKTEPSGWPRLKALVRQTRIERGYPTAEMFASASDVALRVISDIESEGKRTNFSPKTLEKIERALGWAPGSVDRVLTEPRYVPTVIDPATTSLFSPSSFDRTPVPVDVVAIETVITQIDTMLANKRRSTSSWEDLAAAALQMCWPYILRVVEDNCLPGESLHPTARLPYEKFLAMHEVLIGEDPTAHYVQWLAGDLPDVPESLKLRYTKRWATSRKNRLISSGGRRSKNST